MSSGDGLDVFEKTIEASGRGNFLEKRGEHPHVSALPRIANVFVPLFLLKIFVVIESQFAVFAGTKFQGGNA